jgi:hypothetical protein
VQDFRGDTEVDWNGTLARQHDDLPGYEGGLVALRLLSALSAAAPAWARCVLAQNERLWAALLPLACWCHHQHLHAEWAGSNPGRAEAQLCLAQLLGALAAEGPEIVASLTWVHYWLAEVLSSALAGADVLLAAATLGLVRHMSGTDSYCRRILLSPVDRPLINRLLPLLSVVISPLGLLRFGGAAAVADPHHPFEARAADHPEMLRAGAVAGQGVSSLAEGGDVRPWVTMGGIRRLPPDPTQAPQLEEPLPLVALEALEHWAEIGGPALVDCDGGRCYCCCGVWSLEPDVCARCLPSTLYSLLDERRIPAAVPDALRRGLGLGAHRVLVRLLQGVGPRLMHSLLVQFDPKGHNAELARAAPKVWASTAHRPSHPKLEPTALENDEWAKHYAWVQKAAAKGASAFKAALSRVLWEVISVQAEQQGGGIIMAGPAEGRCGAGRASQDHAWRDLAEIAQRFCVASRQPGLLAESTATRCPTCPVACVRNAACPQAAAGLRGRGAAGAGPASALRGSGRLAPAS